MIGRIFSIEEFSVFDGDGIRTTVFLKGCPLRCTWCHNPEGQSMDVDYLRTSNGCINCKRCLDATEKAIGVRKISKYSVNACPNSLIRICGKDIDSTELARLLLKNVDILNTSGGGVTFSGGEPLMQYEFLLSCLKLLKGKTSRAIQTTGFATYERFKNVLSEVDIVLYDLKLLDENMHQKYTGAGNKLILENYKTLVKSNVKFITRIPLIPGVTDTKENIEEICKFMSSLGVEYAELLAYNKMAGGKYKLLDREYAPNFDESQPVNYRVEIFEKYNIKAKKL